MVTLLLIIAVVFISMSSSSAQEMAPAPAPMSGSSFNSVPSIAAVIAVGILSSLFSTAFVFRI
ncbi:hypothetical protein O6H91_02G127700 [Diphasiastrum complanatum]|nr:hypothetical protein O6H91_02G127700 [Diphasiastrum complanatum]